MASSRQFHGKVRLGFELERMESREMMSVTAVWAAQHRAAVTSAAVSMTTPAPLTTGQPTGHLAAIDLFTAFGKGKFLAGPGAYTDKKNQFLIVAGGTSNTSLRAQFVVRLYTPTDPTQPVTGIATMMPQDVSSTGSILILDLTGSTANQDKAGRPTEFTWTVDGNSGGLFTKTDNGLGAGSGTLQIDYINGSIKPHRGPSDGVALIKFTGSINYNRTTNTTAYNVLRL